MVTECERRHLELAAELAKKVKPIRGARVVSFLVRRNQLVSIGRNQLKSHPFQARFASNPKAIFLHAEINAIKQGIRELGEDELAKCTLIVARARKNEAREWEYGMAKPCLGCVSCISAFSIPRVVFTKDVDQIGVM